jgi:signal peptidase I
MASANPPDEEADLSPLEAAAAREGVGVLGYLREWLDALVIAFVLAMFIRTFVVELFKIPSGSMSPTLLGDWIAEGAAYDEDGNSGHFLLIKDRTLPRVQVFRKQPNGDWHYEGKQWLANLSRSQQTMLNNELHLEEHRIFVNKFAYWFQPPKRGDIIVFRVPFKLHATQGYSRNGVDIPPYEYKRSQSTYVKRCVGLPGERIEVRSDQHVYINGERLTGPKAIDRTQYTTSEVSNSYDIEIPGDSVVAMGDNSDNSADSRYWGPLPLNNLRGKAFLRYWPLKKMRFLNRAD